MSRILVAHHDEGTRRLLSLTLGEHQHQVAAVSDGWEAIDFMYDQPVDVVMADVEMPGVNGLGVLAAARAREPYLPVILTGPATCGLAVEAFRFGSDDYVFLPLVVDIVLDSLGRVLEARSLHAEKEKAVGDLRHANAFKAHMLRMMAHDLNNMLTSVKGFGYLAMRMRDPDGIYDCVRHIMGSASFMETVADEISTYAMIDSDELVIEPETFDVTAAIDRAVKTLCIDPSTHHVTIPTEKTEVFADEQRTTQILINLVGNAVRYSPNGGDIEVEVMPMGTQVLCSVKDRGLGIPADQLEKVFEPLVRLDRDDVTRGTGLGLAIVRHLVEMQHGRIWAEVRADGGTVFRFTLPSREAVRREEERAAHPAQPEPESAKAIP